MEFTNIFIPLDVLNITFNLLQLKELFVLCRLNKWFLNNVQPIIFNKFEVTPLESMKYFDVKNIKHINPHIILTLELIKKLDSIEELVGLRTKENESEENIIFGELASI